MKQFIELLAAFFRLFSSDKSDQQIQIDDPALEPIQPAPSPKRDDSYRQAYLEIMPHSKTRIDRFLHPLADAMAEFEIDSKLRHAAFIAQIGHESGQLRYVRELASGEAYEGRYDLGNKEPGDGMRFKGRGLIQITGRANYLECGMALSRDLIGHPELLEEPVNACRSAAWFWKSRGLNELADAGEFVKITRRINGGTNGLTDRQLLYKKALQVLS